MEDSNNYSSDDDRLHSFDRGMEIDTTAQINSQQSENENCESIGFHLKSFEMLEKAEDSEEYEPPKQEGRSLPVVSISKINYNGYKDYSTFAAIINIVEQYNSNKRNKKKEKAKKNQEEINRQTEDVEDSSGDYKLQNENSSQEGDANDEYNKKIYAQTVTSLSTVLNAFGIHEEIKTVNVVIFMYNDNSIYAVTSNGGWQVVQGHVDPNFPQKVAARLLDEGGMIAVESKLLLGNVATHETKLKTKEPTNPMDDPNICLYFRAKLRKTASIRTEMDISDKKAVYVDIRFGSVRFLTFIKKRRLQNIIKHLDKISNGNETTALDGKPEEATTAFRKYIQAVRIDQKNELDRIVLKSFKEYIETGNVEVLTTFEFLHHKLNDFLASTEFTLSMNKKSTKFNDLPTLEEVMKRIRTNDKFAGLCNVLGDENEFNTVFKKINMSYKKDKNKQPSRDSLMNYIEGYIIHEGQVFYRAFKNWYYIAEDYVRHIQSIFSSNLNAHLIGKDHPAALKYEWNHADREDIFNNRFLKEPGFVVGDKMFFHNIELFDILFHDEENEKDKRTYLFHVKKKFDAQHVRYVCAQIYQAAQMIHAYINGGRQHIDELKTIYEKIYQKLLLSPKPSYMESFESFEKILITKPVFVYAVRIDLQDKTHTLNAEKNIRDIISPSIIAELIENSDDKIKILKSFKIDESALGQHIFDELVESGYVKKNKDNNDGIASTSLLLLTGSTSMKSRMTEIQNISVKKLLQAFRTHIESLGAKMSVNKLKTDIEKLNFGFKIYEIEGKKQKTKAGKGSKEIED